MAIIKNKEPIQASKEKGRTGAEIFSSYMELMLELAKDSTRRENFLQMDNKQKSAKDELNAIGIKIPTEIPIYFDKYDTNRPALWLVKGEKGCLVNEIYLGVHFLAKYRVTEDGHKLKVHLDKGHQYTIDMSAFERIIEKTHTLPDKNPMKKFVKDIRDDPSVKDVTHKSLDIKRLFTLKQLRLIKDAYDRKDKDYLVLAKMPYFAINDDLKIAYHVDGYDEIVLTSA